MTPFSLIPPAGPSDSQNPVLDEITRAHASLSDPAKQALMRAGLGPQPPAPAPAAPMMSKPAPQAEGPKMAMSAPSDRLTTPNQATSQYLRDSGSGVSQIKNPFLHALAATGDVLGSALVPGLAQAIPGSTLHHNQLQRQADAGVAQDETVANNASKRGLEGAEAENYNSKPELEATKSALAQEKQNEVENFHRGTLEQKTSQQQGTEEGRKQTNEANLRKAGLKTDETGKIVPVGYEEMSPNEQALHDLKGAQQEAAESSAALTKARASNLPQAAALAQKRLDSALQAHQIALERLGLSEKQFEMRAHGTEGGEALPGAMLNDQNKPVGTAFQQNVRPTGQERNKADLANSAHDQIADLKSIVQKRPDIFGPAAGRSTDFSVWVGSQDPDAQRFRAARTIAGDHLAGVFGGRSEAALKALDDAIGHFKDNPAAVAAGLDQLEKANSRFSQAGTVKTVGSNAAAAGATPNVTTQAEFDKLPKGATYMEDGKQYRKP